MRRQKPWHVHPAGALPTISDIVVHDVSDTGFGIAFTTSKPSRGLVEYGATTTYGTTLGGSSSLTTSHDITVSGLSEGTYHARALARWHDGTTRSADIEIEVTASGSTPTISNVATHTIGETSAYVEWNVAPISTGQVFWGPSTGAAPADFPYRSIKESGFYAYHSQPIGAANDPANPAMSAGTTYYYVVESTDESGRTSVSSVESFTTAGSGEAVSAIYGGIGGRYLANTTITGTITHGAQAFRAERSLAPTSVRMFWQGGSGYSAGDGGEYTVSIFPDNGSGQPDLAATPLAQTTGITPGGTNVGLLVTFTGASALSAGTIYHIVAENTHSNPASNYSSMNCLVGSSTNAPAHYRWTALEHRFQYRYNSAWTIRTAYALVHELTYSDGHSQGHAYMEISYPTVPSAVAYVQGTNYMVRQEFVTTDALTAIGAGIMIQKATGTTDALTVALRDTGAGRGTLLDSDTVAAASVPDGTMSGSNLAATAAWVGVTLSQALSDATTYRLEFSTSGSGEYMAWPIRRGTPWSYTTQVLWPTGQAEYSTDGGSTWTDIAGSNDDLPAYLELSS